jgi:hypothetical protein
VRRTGFHHAKRSWAAALAGLLVVLAPAARAQEAAPAPGADLERKAAARALFQEGLHHADRRDWPRAADQFQRAHALRPSPEIAYNLSTALIRVGKLVRASELLRTIAEDPAAPRTVKRASALRLGEVLPRLARLTVWPPPGSADETVVLLDGQPLAAASLGVALPVDPATHAVQLRRGGDLVAVQEVHLGDGEHQTIRLPDPVVRLPAAAESRLAAAASFATPVDPGPAPPPRRTWLWGVAAAALVGTAVVTVMALRDPRPAANVDTWVLGSQ